MIVTAASLVAAAALGQWGPYNCNGASSSGQATLNLPCEVYSPDCRGPGTTSEAGAQLMTRDARWYQIVLRNIALTENTSFPRGASSQASASYDYLGASGGTSLSGVGDPLGFGSGTIGPGSGMTLGGGVYRSGSVGFGVWV